MVGRTHALLAVLYLLFNEGYAATAGEELVRRSLTEEAIRLTRTLCALMPDEPEALGLLGVSMPLTWPMSRISPFLYCYGGGWLTALAVQTEEVWQADREGDMRRL